MNPTDAKIFKEAVEQAQSGQKVPAYSLLKSLETTNPADLNLILWLAFTTSDFNEAEYLVGKAKTINPADPSVFQAEDWLEKERQKQPLSLPSPPFANPGPALTVNYPPMLVNTNPSAYHDLPGRNFNRGETTLYRDPTVTISNARAIFGSQIFSIPNITSVTLNVLPTRNPVPLLVFCGGMFFALVALNQLTNIGKGDSPIFGAIFMTLIILVSTALSVFLFILSYNLHKKALPDYVIRLTSSSGEVKVLTSTDKQRVEQIVAAINQALIMRSAVRN